MDSLEDSLQREEFEFYVSNDAEPLTLELLDTITDRECYQREGFTRLMIAAYLGDVDMVEQLLSLGDSADVTDRNGRTARSWVYQALNVDCQDLGRVHPSKQHDLESILGLLCVSIYHIVCHC